MDPVIDYVTTVQTTLIAKETLKLVINILNYRSKAEIN
jgi:hypothetical protein